MNNITDSDIFSLSESFFVWVIPMMVNKKKFIQAKILGKNISKKVAKSVIKMLKIMKNNKMQGILSDNQKIMSTEFVDNIDLVISGLDMLLISINSTSEKYPIYDISEKVKVYIRKIPKIILITILNLFKKYMSGIGSGIYTEGSKNFSDYILKIHNSVCKEIDNKTGFENKSLKKPIDLEKSKDEEDLSDDDDF